MDREDAEKIAEVLADVDDGCTVCVAAACAAMTERFPDHPWFELVATDPEDAESLAKLAADIRR